MRSAGIVIVSLLVVLTNAGNVHYDLRDAPYLFLKFVREYDRQYKDAEDVLLHAAAFVTTLDKINKQNELNPDATFDINKFADNTEEELKNHRGLVIRK